MSPSHAVKGKRRYRYYITHSAQLRSDGPSSWRLPAADIEAGVIARIRQMLNDAGEVRAILPPAITAEQLGQAIDIARITAERLDLPSGRRVTLPSLLKAVQCGEEQLTITLDREALSCILQHPIIDVDDRLVLTAPVTKVRAGKATKLMIGQATYADDRCDARLMALLTEATQAREAMLTAPALNIKALAEQRNQCRHRLAKLIRLSWLAPKIVSAILSGKQPATMTPNVLLNLDLPLCWSAQERMVLGR